MLITAFTWESGSPIRALDEDSKSLSKLQGEFEEVPIEKFVGDFISEAIAFQEMDEIMMYVANK